MVNNCIYCISSAAITTPGTVFRVGLLIQDQFCLYYKEWTGMTTLSRFMNTVFECIYQHKGSLECQSHEKSCVPLHFTEDCFEPLEDTVTLKPDAVPTIVVSPESQVVFILQSNVALWIT